MIRNSRSWLMAVVVAAVVTAPALVSAQSRGILVNIDSQPQGATVRLDSESATPLGFTPLTRVRVPRGEHTLYFSHDGYSPATLPITVTRPRQSFTTSLTVAPGRIYVTADVEGAQILLDGNGVGTTPGTINSVPPGAHVIEIRQPGMNPFSQTVTVVAGQMATVTAQIRPPSGTVRVIVVTANGQAVPNDLRVLFDGAPVTGTPPTVDSAPVGAHVLQVQGTGYTPVTQNITVTAGQSTPITVTLQPAVVAPTGGTITVITHTPGAQVFLDNQPLTVTSGTATHDNVAAGTHSLRITADGRRALVRDVPITAGQVQTVEIQDSDLPVVQEFGRLVVQSDTPGATVSVDGQTPRPAPLVLDNIPAGSHLIRVEAQGYDPRSETCNVTPAAPCNLTLPLNRTLGHASLHVELQRAISGAALLIDGNSIGEIGAGRDVPNLTAGTPHEIRIHADGYEDYVESVTLQENENHRTMAALRRSHRGPSGAALASRRAAISTWGAAPLARGDVAVDILGSFGDYPLEVRGTTGLLDYQILGVDAGFSVRSMGYIWELELRARAGVRLLDGLLAFGAELRPFAGLGFSGENNVGLRGFINASLHSLTPQSDYDTDDPNERSNQFGSFALSLHLGFEAMHDGLNGMGYSAPNNSTMPPSTSYNFTACTDPHAFPSTMMLMGDTDPCHLALSTPNMMGAVSVASGAQNLVRAIAGVSIEFGLSRHVNLFLGVDRVISSSDFQQQRAYYQSLWRGLLGSAAGSGDSFTYVRFGLTYKF